jgi:hypothetical protein
MCMHVCSSLSAICTSLLVRVLVGCAQTPQHSPSLPDRQAFYVLTHTSQISTSPFRYATHALIENAAPEPGFHVADVDQYAMSISLILPYFSCGGR